MTTRRISQEFSKETLYRSKERINMQFEHEGELLNLACHMLGFYTACREKSKSFKHNNFPFSCLYLFTRGTAMVKTIQGESKQLKKGKIYLLPAELTLNIDYTPITQHFLHLHICDHSGRTLFDGSTGIQQINDPDLFSFFVSCIKNDDTFGLLLALHRLIHHLMEDRLECLHERSSRAREFGALFTYLRENPPASVTIGDLAKLYQINADSLSKRFKRSMGHSLKGYLQRYILTEAQSLLLCTPDTAVEISNRLGFSSSQYFQRFFRIMTHITPRQFRQRHKEPVRS